MKMKRTITTDAEHEQIEELIAWFFDLVRDYPEVLAKVDATFRQRYGYEPR